VTQITDHLANTRERVANALSVNSRSTDDVMLVAVSKQQPAEVIEEAYRAGQRHFAESYVQEAVDKSNHLAHLDICWHFVGKIQSNKTRAIAEMFHWVHTVDRAKIALRLNEHRRPDASPLNVLIQVNQATEPQKAGVEESEVEALAKLITAQPRLKLRGLMSIPPKQNHPSQSIVFFERLRDLRRRLAERNIEMDTLSMGMSTDFEAAIAAGSTCVRIGTAIFGPRAIQTP